VDPDPERPKGRSKKFSCFEICTFPLGELERRVFSGLESPPKKTYK
jgi:hypothetical protein